MTEYEIKVVNDNFTNYYLNFNVEYDTKKENSPTIRYKMVKILDHLHRHYQKDVSYHSKRRMLTALFAYGLKRFYEETADNIKNLPLFNQSQLDGIFSGDIETMNLIEKYQQPGRIFTLKFDEVMNNKNSTRKYHYRLESVDDLLGDLKDLGFESNLATHFILLLGVRDTIVVDKSIVGNKIDKITQPTLNAINNLFDYV